MPTIDTPLTRAERQVLHEYLTAASKMLENVRKFYGQRGQETTQAFAIAINIIGAADDRVYKGKRP